MTDFKLKSFDTQNFLLLKSRPPGTYKVVLEVQGNSILSTLYIKTLDVGATVKANYYEDTLGGLFGERKELPGHPLQSAASTNPSKITITPFHNSPILEVIVTGGNAEFSVRGTAVNSFATDLDSALHLDADPGNLLEDKGLPVQCYDEATGAFYFLRCKEGAINISGSVTLPPVTERVFGSSLVADTLTVTLITHSPATLSKRVQRILVGGDGYGEFTVKINGDTWGIIRNSWNDRTKIVEFGNKLITNSDTIIVEVTNVSIGSGGSCTYESVIYLTEDP